MTELGAFKDELAYVLIGTMIGVWLSTLAIVGALAVWIYFWGFEAMYRRVREIMRNEDR